MARRFGRVNVVSKNIFDYNVGIIGESGIGKEQPLSAKIITPTGVKTMGDMKVGSQVIGQDGKPYNVTGIYPQGVKPVYKISFSDGSYTECGLEHLWKVYRFKDGKFDNGSIVTLNNLIKDIENIKNKHYFIEIPNAVMFEDSLSDNNILYSNLKVRREFLGNIINKSGYKNSTKDIVIPLDKINKLKVMEFVAKSLGFLFYIEDNNIILKGNFEELELNSSFNGVKKRINQKIAISNIEYVGNKECQCIMIDNPEHLYLTDDFIVTHNTTLIKEVCEKTAGRDGYIVFDVGREDGTKAISGIVAETVTTFEHQLDDDGNKLPKYEGTKGVGVMDVVDDIVEYKDEYYKDLKVVVFDTLDELINITENYVVDLANKENRRKGKPADVSTINEAFGGFMRGQDRVIEEILKVKDRLNAIGVQFWFVGHTKMRTKTDPLTQAEYDSFTTNLPQRYFVAFKDKLHFLGVIVMDRQIDKTIEKQFGHSVTKGILSNEKRIINFRDDNYAIDSKSRFADIEPTIEYGADNFIQAIEDAIEKERNADNTVNTEKLEKERESEEEKEAKKIKEATISKIKNENIDEDELKTKALNEIKVILSNEVNQTENLSTIQKILQENKVGNLVNAELSILNDIISKLVK